MHLSKEELELLINESVCGRYIQCRFGPSFVALNDAPENEWAKQRINEVRVAATGGAVAHVNQLAQPAICPHCQTDTSCSYRRALRRGPFVHIAVERANSRRVRNSVG